MIMNKEIKEILEKLKDREETYQFCKQHKLSINDWIYEAHFLLDYILDLQVENEMMRKLIDKASEFIKEKISSTKGVINDYMYHKEHNKQLIELLNEDIEMYKYELNILQNGSDDNE